MGTMPTRLTRSQARISRGERRRETDMPKLPFSISRFWLTPFLLMVSIGCGAQAPVPEPVTDQETELGQEMYKELANKGEIIEILSSLRYA